MPLDDALRWNARYQDPAAHWPASPRPLLREVAHLLPTAGLALDVAMGLGGNAALLLERGLRVVGIDISLVAVRRAKARLPALGAVVLDLTRFTLPPETFDVILNFYYLNPDLWPQYRRALKPGGVLVFETMTRAMLAVRPDLDPGHLLEPGELRAAFCDWDVLVDFEGWRSGRAAQRKAVAQLVARRPAR